MGDERWGERAMDEVIPYKPKCLLAHCTGAATHGDYCRNHGKCGVATCEKRRVSGEPHCWDHSEAVQKFREGRRTGTEVREYLKKLVLGGDLTMRTWWDTRVPVAAMTTEPQIVATPKAQAEARCAEVLGWDQDTLAYLYVLLYEGHGLRLESCLARLRRLRWR